MISKSVLEELATTMFEKLDNVDSIAIIFESRDVIENNKRRKTKRGNWIYDRYKTINNTTTKHVYEYSFDTIELKENIVIGKGKEIKIVDVPKTNCYVSVQFISKGDVVVQEGTDYYDYSDGGSFIFLGVITITLE